MTKSKLLNIGIISCKALRIFYMLIFVVLTGFFIHFQINSSFYKNFDYNFDTKNLISGLTIKTSSSYKIHVGEEVPKDSEVFKLNKLRFSSLYFNYIKMSLIFILSFCSVKEFQKVIESVKSIKTFQERNIISFRRIGKYVLIIFILMSYSSFKFQLGGMSGFYISFELLILSLLAFIMAEIFKEGNSLMEEQKLTV